MKKPVFIAAIALIFSLHSAVAKQQPVQVAAEPVSFARIDVGQTRFGALLWRGGIVISSEHKHFGGFSGLIIEADGTKITAVSDRGWWLDATLDYKQGRLTGIQNAHMGRLVDHRARPYGKKKRRDAESIDIRTDKYGRRELLVSFERNHRIIVYKNGLEARARRIRQSGQLNGLTYNKGIEAIAVFGANTPLKGALIAISEGSFDDQGNHLAWLLTGPKPGRLSVKRRDDFHITDAASLANGDLLILERKVSFPEGPRFRIRRIGASTISPGAVLDGEILIDAGLLNNIDNMEGLSVHQTSDGETRLTLISDDNFDDWQQTLLLQFALPRQ